MDNACEARLPPTTRYTPERILDVALHLTRTRGIEAITARTVAAELGCSTGPLFTHFESMDDLVEQLMDRVIALFVESAGSVDHEDPVAGAAMGWLRFAAEQPRLYEALFLKHHEWDAKWGPVRLRLARRMAEHPRYRHLDDPTRFALVGRSAIVLHGLGVEIWSRRLPAPHDYERLYVELAKPVIDAALAHGWSRDLHSLPTAPSPTDSEEPS